MDGNAWMRELMLVIAIVCLYMYACIYAYMCVSWVYNHRYNSESGPHVCSGRLHNRSPTNQTGSYPDWLDKSLGEFIGRRYIGARRSKVRRGAALR